MPLVVCGGAGLVWDASVSHRYVMPDCCGPMIETGAILMLYGSELRKFIASEVTDISFVASSIVIN